MTLSDRLYNCLRSALVGASYIELHVIPVMYKLRI